MKVPREGGSVKLKKKNEETAEYVIYDCTRGKHQSSVCASACTCVRTRKCVFACVGERKKRTSSGRVSSQGPLKNSAASLFSPRYQENTRILAFSGILLQGRNLRPTLRNSHLPRLSRNYLYLNYALESVA